MISDITFGQYFPGQSFLHKVDPRIKILLTIAQIILTFVASTYMSLITVVLQTLLVILLSGINIGLYIKNLKIIMFVVIFTALLNLFYGVGEPIFSFLIFKITEDSIKNSIFVSTRIICLIFISSSLTFTTLPSDLANAIELLMRPLKLLKVPVHEIAMMMTIALRFIPTLLEETNKIIMAQKARGADFDSSGKLIKKIKAFAPILILLFISSFRRAYDLAVAMECRCYRGAKGRTRMRKLKVGSIDIVAILFIFFYSSLLIVFNNT
ncbi:MAG: energy-coupling factor transporter transmembrane protein EcfT [Oscillospiraceae bacterium]|nr:energy-coupling factor transporter transmembrane protein EcfT [Oscillospiraceae bacterium]